MSSGTTSNQLITFELQAIYGSLRLALAGLNQVKVQAQPGPIMDPVQMNLLAAIVTTSQQVTAAAQSIPTSGSPIGGS